MKKYTLTKNLISRKMHKVMNKIAMNKAMAEAEKQERLYLENLAIHYKNKGIKTLTGSNYILEIK